MLANTTDITTAYNDFFKWLHNYVNNSTVFELILHAVQISLFGLTYRAHAVSWLHAVKNLH